MRGKSILASATLAAAAIGTAATLPGITLAKSAGNHRRASNGPGTKACQRAARKARSVQRNRKAHRG